MAARLLTFETLTLLQVRVDAWLKQPDGNERHLGNVRVSTPLEEGAAGLLRRVSERLPLPEGSTLSLQTADGHPASNLSAIGAACRVTVTAPLSGPPPPPPPRKARPGPGSGHWERDADEAEALEVAEATRQLQVHERLERPRGADAQGKDRGAHREDRRHRRVIDGRRHLRRDLAHQRGERGHRE